MDGRACAYASAALSRASPPLELRASKMPTRRHKRRPKARNFWALLLAAASHAHFPVSKLPFANCVAGALCSNGAYFYESLPLSTQGCRLSEWALEFANDAARMHAYYAAPPRQTNQAPTCGFVLHIENMVSQLIQNIITYHVTLYQAILLKQFYKNCQI